MYDSSGVRVLPCLNAPLGAWCFLTLSIEWEIADQHLPVLMHLLALGAFWRWRPICSTTRTLLRFNVPHGARGFMTGSKLESAVAAIQES